MVITFLSSVAGPKGQYNTSTQYEVGEGKDISLADANFFIKEKVARVVPEQFVKPKKVTYSTVCVVKKEMEDFCGRKLGDSGKILIVLKPEVVQGIFIGEEYIDLNHRPVKKMTKHTGAAEPPIHP